MAAFISAARSYSSVLMHFASMRCSSSSARRLSGSRLASSTVVVSLSAAGASSNP